MERYVRKGLTLWMVALGAVLFLTQCDAQGEDLWLSATVKSYHGNRDRGYNENNFGLGFETTIGKDLRAVGGFYENSYYHTTLYAGAAWLPLHAGPVHGGLLIAGATGYENWPVRPVVLPTIAVEGKTFGANVGIMPSLNRGIGVIGLQLKVRIK